MACVGIMDNVYAMSLMLLHCFVALNNG